MAEWDALPPRRKQRRVGTSSEEQDSSVKEDVKNDQPKLAESLLTSQDGCASEFYECM